MAEPWIRVHANLAAKPVVWRAVETLRIHRAEAVGLLVSFWGAVSQHAPNGTVRDYPDAQLEAWAGWERKRGRFAAFVRAHHLDSDGRVNEWDEYAGVLEEQRRQARDRKRRSRGRHGDGHSDNDVTSSPTRRDETIRDVEPATAAAAEAEAGLAVMLVSDADRNALTVVASRASDRLACLTALTSMLTGNDPATPQPTPELFGQALRDIAANGERITARKFRNYLTDAKRAAVEAGAPSRPPTRGASRPSTGQRAFDTALAAIEDM